MENRWHFFEPREVVGLKDEFVAMLDRARGVARVPFVITSGFRTVEQNQASGGADQSSHELGLAVDLACGDSSIRFKILKALLAVGFSRIGVYDKHLHVDADPTKPQNVIWWGISH